MHIHFATATQTIRYIVTNNPITLLSWFNRFHNPNNVTQQTVIIVACAVHDNKWVSRFKQSKNMQHFKHLGKRYNTAKIIKTYTAQAHLCILNSLYYTKKKGITI